MNEMINSCTSLFPLLTIAAKNSAYYNYSVFLFTTISTVNHILPENFDGLTHIVKLLFSNILFSTIDLNPLLGFALSLIDLIPIFTNSEKMKKLGEFLLQPTRLGIELYLMYIIFPSHPFQVLIMLICKVIYFFERRARINKGIRNDFSSFHAFEHLGLYLLFKNAMQVELYFLHYVYIFFTFNFLIWCALKILNEYLYKNMLNRAPTWVKDSPELTVLLKKKLLKNKDSILLHNYVCKPWTAHLKLEFISWTHMIEIVDNMLKNINPSDYDQVIGITTGGSFVGTYVAKRLNKPYASILSKLWSESGLKINFLQTCKYFMGVEQKPKCGKCPTEVKGKRILLIDDTTYTGITLAGIKKVILEVGEAQSVTTMVMWMRGKYFPDYYYSTKRIPILWEWGAELD